MKYPKLEIKKENKFTVDDFGGGIDLLREDAPIADCKNMIYSAGSLKNRPNIELTQNGTFYNASSFCINKNSIYDTEIFLGGECYKVAVFSSEEEEMRVDYSFFLMSEKGETIEIASLEFSRASYQEFNRPQSITVFAAKEKKGCGIYAFVSVQNQFSQTVENEYSLRMYELNYEMTSWELLTSEDMYIPEYYVNGRGNLYKDSVLNLPTPSFKEPLNMLSDSFKCTYTSDGCSTIFYIPEDLVNSEYFEALNCALHLGDGDVLNFTVGTFSNKSNIITYNNEEVYITFSPNGLAVEFKNYVPEIVYGMDNNIVITIRQKNPEHTMRLATVNTNIWYSSRESGTYLCLAGNIYNPSQICISGKDNPFYFPDTGCHLIGNPTQKIVALAKQNKELIIFKEKELYCVDCTSDKFTITHLHAKIGCDLPSTIVLCENRLVWANSDNKVYTLNALSDYGSVAVYNMSRSIEWELADEDFSTATGCYCNRRYYLFLNNRVYVLDLSGALLQTNREFVTAAAWFRWELPDTVLVEGAYAGKNLVNMVCGIKDGTHYYMASLCGEDGVDKYLDATLTVQKKPLESTLTTGIFYDNNYCDKKLFTKLFLGVFAERDVFIDFNNEMGDTAKNVVINIKYNGKKPSYSYRILPLIRCLGISVKIRAYGNIKLNKLTFKYKETV